MKLLYLAFLWTDDIAGVNRKIINQIKALNSLPSVRARGAFIIFDSSGKNKINIPGSDTISIEPIKLEGKPPQKKLFYEKAEAILRKNNECDFIYFRYPLSDPWLLELTGKYGHKIIFEHQTLELAELAALEKAEGSWPLLYLREIFELLRYGHSTRHFLTTYINELFFAPLVLSRVHGLVGVTEEITAYEKSRALFSKPRTATIANGIDVEAFPVRCAPSFNGRELELLFIGSETYSWHNLERLIAAMAGYRGNVRIRLHIAGKISTVIHNTIERLKLKNRVFAYGIKNIEEINKLVSRCHIAVGALGIHRKGLTEASTLKVREYCARGIPFILSEKDPDIENEEEIAPFFMRVPQDDRPLEMMQILDFAQKTLGIREHPDIMRNFARRKLDISIKAKQLISFLDESGTSSCYRSSPA